MFGKTELWIHFNSIFICYLGFYTHFHFTAVWKAKDQIKRAPRLFLGRISIVELKNENCIFYFIFKYCWFSWGHLIKCLAKPFAVVHLRTRLFLRCARFIVFSVSRVVLEPVSTLNAISPSAASVPLSSRINSFRYLVAQPEWLITVQQ